MVTLKRGTAAISFAVVPCFFIRLKFVLISNCYFNYRKCGKNRLYCIHIQMGLSQRFILKLSEINKLQNFFYRFLKIINSTKGMLLLT